MAEIIWQDRAVQQFEHIQNYLLVSFGEKVVAEFTKRIFKFLDSLSKFPTIGRIQHEALNIRGFVISRQTSILYKVEADKVFILAFIDNRINPIFEAD